MKAKKVRLKNLVGGVLLLLLLMGGGGVAVYFLYERTDTEEEIRNSAADLRLIWRGIREFQSEGYFGRAPKSLEELNRYRAVFYIPKPSPGKDLPSPGFAELERSYMLIPDPLAFLNPATHHQPVKGKFICDYTLLRWYEMFLPGDTIIVWDNPGNFKTGGNVLYYSGRVDYCKMEPAEYRRFVKALQTRSDREFVRKKCKEASVSGFRKDPVDE